MLHDDSFVTGLLIGDKKGYKRGYDEGFEEGGGGTQARDTIEFGSGMTPDIWKVPAYDSRPVNGSLDDTLPANRCQWTLWRINYCCGVLSAIYGVIVLAKLKNVSGTLTKDLSTIYLNMLAKGEGTWDAFAETSFKIDTAGNVPLRAWNAPMWLIVAPTMILCVTRPHGYQIPWVLFCFTFGQTKDGGAWRTWPGVSLNSSSYTGYNGTAGSLDDTSLSETINLGENQIAVPIGNEAAKVENMWWIRNTNGIFKDDGNQKVIPNFASVGTATKHPSGRRLLYFAHNVAYLSNYGDIQNLYFILLPKGTSKPNWRGLLDEDIVNQYLLPWDEVPGVDEDNEVPPYAENEKQDSTPNSYYSGYNKGYQDGLAAGGGGGDPGGDYDEGYQAGYTAGYAAGVEASGSDDGYTLHPAADGATELYIKIEADQLRSMQLCICQTLTGGVQINWGDGTVETMSGTGVVYPEHTYAAIGEYTIRLLPADGCALTLGGGTVASKTIFNENGSPVAGGRGCVLVKAVIGSGISTIGRYAFSMSHNLQEVYVTDGVEVLGNSCFQYCYALHRIRLPETLTTLADGNEFYNCYGLSDIKIPDSVTAVGINTFTQCNGLRKIAFGGITRINNVAMSTCRGLQRVDFPATLTTLAYNFASQCFNLREIHIAATTPPALNGTLATGYSNFVVYVPSGTLATYAAATNWSRISTKLIEE